MHIGPFLIAAVLYVAAVVRLRHAWRYPSAEGVAVGRARRLWMGAAARAHYFAPAGQAAVRQSRWLLVAAFLCALAWLALTTVSVGTTT